jgi:Subtilase family
MDNGVGNAGYCPECGLMVIQVGTDSGASLSNIANGLIYAADHGARVANLSWAGSRDSATLQSAINYAHDKGVVIFAAAGNSNCNCVTYPAADQNVLGIGGVANAAGDKQGDSNYGNWVDLAAPEGNMTAWPSINGAPGYAGVGGTSMASPAAAGIAGLLLSYKPSLTTSQVEQALETSAAPVSFPIAYGRVDALAALQYVGATDPQPSSAPVQTAASQIYYEVNGWTSIAPLTAAPQVGQVLVRGIGGWTGSSGLSVTGLQWQLCDAGGGNCSSVSNQSTYAIQSADAGHAIKLVFGVQNSSGIVPVSVLTQPVGSGSAPAPAPSPPPSNTSPPAISGTPQEGQTLLASTGSWSGSPTTYAYQWFRCDAGGGRCGVLSGATASSYGLTASDVSLTLRVQVVATNATGSTAASSAATGVVAPATIQAFGAATFSGSLNAKQTSQTYSLTVGSGQLQSSLSFSKWSSLTLTVTGADGTVVASGSGPSILTVTKSLPAGSYRFLVDGSGKGGCSFTLAVKYTNP